jgi:hypothetical protein
MKTKPDILMKVVELDLTQNFPTRSFVIPLPQREEERINMRKFDTQLIDENVMIKLIESV